MDLILKSTKPRQHSLTIHTSFEEHDEITKQNRDNAFCFGVVLLYCMLVQYSASKTSCH